MKILKSVVALAVISSLGGWLAATVGAGFWPAFGLTLCLQFVSYWCVQAIISKIQAYSATKLSIIQHEVFEGRGTDLQCAWCGTEHFIPIDFTTDNRFECDNCGKENAIYINITVAQPTAPLNVNPLTTSVFDEGVRISNSINESRV